MGDGSGNLVVRLYTRGYCAAHDGALAAFSGGVLLRTVTHSTSCARACGAGALGGVGRAQCLSVVEEYAPVVINTLVPIAFVPRLLSVGCGCHRRWG